MQTRKYANKPTFLQVKETLRKHINSSIPREI